MMSKEKDLKDMNNPDHYFSVKLFKYLDELKKDKAKLGALIALLLIVISYIASIISRMSNGGFSQYDPNTGHTYNYSISPFSTIPDMFKNGDVKYVLYLVSIIGVVLLFMKLTIPSSRYDSRGFTTSTKGTYGTSGWMTRKEVDEILEVDNKKEVKGPIFGKIDDNQHVVTFKKKPYLNEEGEMIGNFNRNMAVYGASGSGKSRSFVRPQIFQCARREESMVITDPKSEIFQSTAGFLENEGYDVRVFNLAYPKYGDCWNAVGEVVNAPEDMKELEAETFAKVVIKNASDGGKGEKFWEDAETALLKALVLYIATDDSRRYEDKTFGEVYRLISERQLPELESMFDVLYSNHPAKKAWGVFDKAPPNVKGNILIGLSARLQSLQSEMVKKLVSQDDIDLVDLGRKKTVLYVIMSDQDTALNFYGSLLFSFLFIRLVRYADNYCEDQVLPIPVNLILDEFPNVGIIPDFDKKIATVRSRGINIALIFQNIAQLQNLYPNNVWETIMGNCDSQVFLGCNDQTTAEYISKRTGILTVEVSSVNVAKNITGLASNTNYRQTESEGRRQLLEMDEVLRLKRSECMLIAQGCKPLKLRKLDFTEHPDAYKLVSTPIKDYVPYRKKVKDTEEIKSENNTMKNDDTTDKAKETDDIIQNFDKNMSNSRAYMRTARNRRSSNEARNHNNNDNDSMSFDEKLKQKENSSKNQKNKNAFTPSSNNIG